ncbi:hypothetical protein C8R46DRAFT_34794, partial [Mycena filopes]
FNIGSPLSRYRYSVRVYVQCTTSVRIFRVWDRCRWIILWFVYVCARMRGGRWMREMGGSAVEGKAVEGGAMGGERRCVQGERKERVMGAHPKTQTSIRRLPLRTPPLPNPTPSEPKHPLQQRHLPRPLRRRIPIPRIHRLRLRVHGLREMRYARIRVSVPRRDVEDVPLAPVRLRLDVGVRVRSHGDGRVWLLRLDGVAPRARRRRWGEVHLRGRARAGVVLPRWWWGRRGVVRLGWLGVLLLGCGVKRLCWGCGAGTRGAAPGAATLEWDWDGVGSSYGDGRRRRAPASSRVLVGRGRRLARPRAAVTVLGPGFGARQRCGVCVSVERCRRREGVRLGYSVGRLGPLRYARLGGEVSLYGFLAEVVFCHFLWVQTRAR